MEKDRGPFSLKEDYTGRVAKSNFYFKMAAGTFALATALYLGKQEVAAGVIFTISLATTVRGLEIRYGNKG